MRFMVQVRSNEYIESGAMPKPEMLEEMGRFNEGLGAMMLAGDGLKDSSKGSRIVFTDGKTSVVDGPFPTNEVVAGFWIVQAASKDEVIERFRKAPMLDGDVLEIRPIFEAEDFANL